METNRLKQFCTIVETGSMTKAALLHHLTHSALSKSIKTLQNELGFQLLRPDGRGVTPTDIGLKIYAQIKKLLDEEEKLLRGVEFAEKPTIRIGTSEIFLKPLCSSIEIFSKQSKAIEILEMNPGEMEQKILERQLDFGVTYVPITKTGVDIIKVGEYRLKCFVKKGAFKGVLLKDLPFVVPKNQLSANPLNIKERDGWLDSIYPRQKKFFVNLLSTALELTLQGHCAIYLPSFVADEINRSKILLVEYQEHKIKKQSHSVFLLKHHHQHDVNHFQALRVFCEQFFR